MEIKGKIILDLGERSGTSKSGNPWKAHEYVLETLDQYPRKIHFDFFGDRADQYVLKAGETVTLSFDIESREYNGRWFTNIRGWKADKDNGGNQIQVQQGPSDTQVAPPDITSHGGDDDLPF